MGRKTCLVVVAVPVVVVCIVWSFQESGELSDYQPRSVSPIVSTSLNATTVVPTLDTPLVDAGNAVWCATFQAAWNHACEDVIRGPLRITNAGEVAERLNASQVSDETLPPGSFYVAAGRHEDGISGAIHAQMSRQFPNVGLPVFDDDAGFVAYCYLEAKSEFLTPFTRSERPVQFSGADGNVHGVRSFGLSYGSEGRLQSRQAEQVEVLFSESENPNEFESLTAFALDLTADRPDEELIIAVLPRAKDLQSMLHDLHRRIEKFAPDSNSARLDELDVFDMPNVTFQLDHEFAELQGADKRVESPGEFQNMEITTAFQSIKFRLDESGATVISESGVAAAAIPRLFIVDRPFLIIMKRRSEALPWFVAWIENAELLETL